MNPAHYHLLFNHLPIIIPIVGTLVMLGALIVRSEIVKRVAFCIFILGGLVTFPALFTGEGAEEVVEHLPDMSRKIIHIHEEAADTFGILSYILGGISILGLWANWKQKSFANWISYAVIAYSFVVLFFAQETGRTGGEIRHTEIRTTNESGLSNPEMNLTKPKIEHDED